MSQGLHQWHDVTNGGFPCEIIDHGYDGEYEMLGSITIADVNYGAAWDREGGWLITPFNRVLPWPEWCDLVRAEKPKPKLALFRPKAVPRPVFTLWQRIKQWLA